MSNHCVQMNNNIPDDLFDDWEIDVNDNTRCIRHDDGTYEVDRGRAELSNETIELIHSLPTNDSNKRCILYLSYRLADSLMKWENKFRECFINHYIYMCVDVVDRRVEDKIDDVVKSIERDVERMLN